MRQTARATLDKYEHSTVTNNLARRYFPVQPRETILCSAFPERPVISLTSYDAIKELEARRRKIGYLVRHSMYLRYGYRRCAIAVRNPNQMEKVAEALERALWICTDLADIEARRRKPSRSPSPVSEKLECSHQPVNDPAEGRPPTNTYFSSEAIVFNTVLLNGHRVPHIHLDGTTHGIGSESDQDTAENSGPRGSLPSNAIRQEQLDTVHKLSTEDLSAMFVLSSLATKGFEEYLGKNRMKNYPRDIVTEWCVAVAENAYRHGVFFLYPQALRGQPNELSSTASTHDNTAPYEQAVVNGPFPGLQLPNTPPQQQPVAAIADETITSSDMLSNSLKSKVKPTWNRRNPCCVSCSRRMAGHAAAMVCQVVEEMHRWEEGLDDMLPSLTMTIRGLLRRRFHCEMDDVHQNATLVIRGRRPMATLDM